MPTSISSSRMRSLGLACLTSLFFATLASTAHAEQDFASCVAGMRGQATAQGISAATFDSQMNGLTPDMTVLDLEEQQPEFKTPIWDYLAALVDDQRIADGRAMLAQWRSMLDAVESRFGAD